MQYTPAQSQAIEQRGCSILLSAGAGSGKTKVLVERIIKMITEEKVSVDRLLVVTFTKAAAGEMKNRIAEALNKKIAQNPQDTYLRNQSMLLNNAAITTIHSFCLDLIRENYYLLDLDANCKVTDETESYILKEDALDQYLEFKYQQNDPLFQQLLQRYGGKEDEKVRQIIFMLYNQAISLPNYENWLKDLGQALTDESYWQSEAQKLAEKYLGKCAQKLSQAIKTCQEDENCQKKYLAAFLSEQAAIDTARQKLSKSTDAFLEYLEKSEIFALSVRASKKESELFNTAVAAYKQAKALFAELTEKTANAHSTQISADLAEIYPFVSYFGRLTLGFIEYYTHLKCKRRLLDFDDMGHLALELLYDADGAPTALSRELKSRYQAVLIDEYQDTNDLQEKIMLAVSREDNYFMVGDVKQSIYSFRMANPSLFQHKYETFTAEQIINMNKNFRSRLNIVNAVNDVFSLLMTGDDDNPNYKADAQMEYGATYYQADDVADAPVKVWSLSKEKETIALEDDDEENKQANNEKKEVEMEAELIAEEINKLLNQKELVYDKELNSYRPISFHDIVIIMRAPSNGGNEIFQILTDYGIPCYLEKQSGYFSSWEVQITLDILRILDNPQQDLPLAAVLRAPFIGFTNYSDEELLRIRRLAPKSNLYEALEKACDEAELKEKATVTLQKLSELRQFAVQCPISELILHIYQECNLPEYAEMLPQGAQRRNNLAALYDKALQYEQISFHGLFMFLAFLEKMQKKNQSIEPAPLIGENVDVVRIMSIHQSKGLEFPVVFIPKVHKSFNAKDYTSDILLDKSLGLILPNVDLTERVIYPSICTEIIREKKKAELISEEKRILYVAMTRAREQLYFIGQETAEKEDEKSYLDWLNKLTDASNPCQAAWEFKTVSASSNDPIITDNTTADCAALPEPNDIEPEIFQALSWQYPYLKQCYIPAKTSVTAINEQKMPDIHFFYPTEFKQPDFMQEQSRLSAAEKGTVLHTIMNHLDLTKKIDLEYLNELTAQLQAKNILPDNELMEKELSWITRFFATALGQRLQKAEVVYRERPFTLPIEISDAAQNPCTVLVQGIIDCMWQEEGGWVLVDYKSNRIPRERENEFIAKYQAQIDLYAKAIKQIWQKPLKAAYLYPFYTGNAIEMKINE